MDDDDESEPAAKFVSRPSGPSIPGPELLTRDAARSWLGARLAQISRAKYTEVRETPPSRSVCMTSTSSELSQRNRILHARQPGTRILLRCIVPMSLLYLVQTEKVQIWKLERSRLGNAFFPLLLASQAGSCQSQTCSTRCFPGSSMGSSIWRRSTSLARCWTWDVEPASGPWTSPRSTPRPISSGPISGR